MDGNVVSYYLTTKGECRMRRGAEPRLCVTCRPKRSTKFIRTHMQSLVRFLTPISPFSPSCQHYQHRWVVPVTKMWTSFQSSAAEVTFILFSQHMCTDSSNDVQVVSSAYADLMIPKFLHLGWRECHVLSCRRGLVLIVDSGFAIEVGMLWEAGCCLAHAPACKRGHSHSQSFGIRYWPTLCWAFSPQERCCMAQVDIHLQILGLQYLGHDYSTRQCFFFKTSLLGISCWLLHICWAKAPLARRHM